MADPEERMLELREVSVEVCEDSLLDASTESVAGPCTDLGLDHL